jgi:hypothetical protein
VSAASSNSLGGLVRRGEPLRTSVDAVYSAKITVRATDDAAHAFKSAVLDGRGKLEPTLRAMIRLYVEDLDFRRLVDESR